MSIVADRTTACDEIDFAPVPYESREWDDDDDHWTSNDAVLFYKRDQPLRFFELLDESLIPPDDAPDFEVTTRPDYWSSMADAGIDRLPALTGGCDDIPPPFEPSEADWAEFREWCESVDALDAFNDDRLDN